MRKLIGPFSEVVSFEEAPLKGPMKDEQLGIIANGGILVSEGIIEQVGDFESMAKEFSSTDIEEVTEASVALPGLIDCHTHICFAGTRSKDFAMRNAGISYLEIAKQGGGIWDSVTQTREASEDILKQNVVMRADKLLSRGVTTIEVKSGYGLSIEDELKMLRAIAKAGKKTKADLVSTCLAAHIKPKDFIGTHAQYLEYMAKNLFPLLKSEGLTNRIDAFIEDEAFSSEVVDSYFKSARMMDFDITVHADQFHVGGSKVAVEHGALSADHLEASGEEEIALLAQSEVVAVALPGATLGLGCDFTPARKILDAGGCVAIASDWNPGSAPMGNLLTQASILATFQKMSTAEVLAGVTYRAAHALGLKDRGKLNKGQLADLAVFPTNDTREILYQQGELLPFKVYKGGIVI